MKLIVEPDDGVAPVLAAIKKARKSVEIAIFRFDRKDVESALIAAAAAKVTRVTALIAFANRGGEKNLRELELRFLGAGIIVARSDEDLARYHAKYILIDRRVLYVLSFNLTRLDIDRSRGFGIVTTNASWIREAVDLFQADCARTTYEPKSETFVVSPANARKALAAFLKRAEKQLLIYDPRISDPKMLGLLQERTKAGVEVRVIGQVTGRMPFDVRKLAGHRLHTRTIIRDGHQAFVGSQSLRRAELESRREVGLIVRDVEVVRRLAQTFESDWEASAPGRSEPAPKEPESAPEDQDSGKKVVQVFEKELDPLAVNVKRAVRKAVAEAGEGVLHDKEVKDTMKKVVKKAVKEAVNEAVEEAQGKKSA